jgi:hypothetical protein
MGVFENLDPYARLVEEELYQRPVEFVDLIPGPLTMPQLHLEDDGALGLEQERVRLRQTRPILIHISYPRSQEKLASEPP